MYIIPMDTTAGKGQSILRRCKGLPADFAAVMVLSPARQPQTAYNAPVSLCRWALKRCIYGLCRCVEECVKLLKDDTGVWVITARYIGSAQIVGS